ncbi:HDIG domain-containing protein [Alkaliphilus pronyensis]|uniref:HDIG domain-containing protein n=1 Tax=Alkaliphilus pronyensis TaxID=1482732 RepID=A0A6I0F993_9FIRM|nr:HDIG domain-containing metalloprotein [Alkaliphilus pronyensis]KAB3535354.1 HDIG domain-containing protein [Alkaliphilus pronyensis]
MGKLRGFKDKLPVVSKGKVLKHKKAQLIIIALLFFVSIFAILTASLKPEQFDLSVGQRAPSDIRASKNIEDRWLTEKRKEEAAEAQELQYKLDQSVQSEVKKDVEGFFTLINEIRNDEELDTIEKRLLLEDNNLNISGPNLNVALEAPIERIKYLENYIYEIIAQNMRQGIKIEDLQTAKNEIKDYILGLEDFDDPIKELAISVINATIRPNKFLDIDLTEQKRQEAREEVEKVMIQKGDIILREGEIVTFDRMKIMQELGLLIDNSKIDFMLYTGITAIVLVLMLLIISYIYVFNRELFKKPSKLVLMLIIIVLTLIISKAVSVISIYLMPVALSAMLLSILIDARISILINLCLAILIGIITGNDIMFNAMALIGGTVGVFSMINTQQRGNIFISGLMVSLANVITIVAIGFIHSNEVTKVLTFGFYSILNGVLCAILTVGSLPMWEALFNIVTPLKLLELSNPNHPLLKKLLIEAPGTYHHSIIVGNLSEAAANAVEGISLLARTGAFYHDIGKTCRPYFFKENQLTSENPHDNINPSLSSLIITGHVKEGIELANKYKLPKEIQDFILQHHGDTLVAYFYHKAKNMANGEEVDEQTFRYSGIKPQNKETAIVMLADSVEAAVRSLTSPTKDKIENMIHKIVKDKLEDGQLEESNLTLKELEKIKQAFISVIMGIFHERIEYPDIDSKDTKGRKAHELSN